MAARVDFFFRQRVSEAELDLAFELLEQADRNLAADIGVYGVVSGAVPAPHAPVADLTIDLTAPGRAYDNLGQRIFFGTGQTVDCAVDRVGIPTDVSSAGNERWLGVFLRFRRLLSDPRTDGNSQQIFFRRDESFELVVRQAPEGPSGGAPRVALQADELLICEVRRRPGQTQIVESDLDLSRRQAFVFAQGGSVAVESGLWTILGPGIGTAQAALDAVDAVLAEHLSGTARRHRAADVDFTPHGFLDGTDVQAALEELVDDLGAAVSGTPGAARIGADAVPGAPHALSAGTVDAQLSALLGLVNAHVGAPGGSHSASGISALPHSYISGTTVQAQLQEIVADLASIVTGQAGSQRVGSEALAGAPCQLPAGAVKDQLAALLGFINVHLTQYADAHDAVNISVSDYPGHLNATEVEGALMELADGFRVDHYRASETHQGQHRTIHQPNFGGAKALLWDALGTGGVGARFRVYADEESVWFTVNASYTGSAWTLDSPLHGAAGFRISGSAFEVYHQPLGSGAFSTFERQWRLPLGTAGGTGFELHGPLQQEGRLGAAWTNTAGSTQNVTAAGACTYRSRFAATPSSITLAVNHFTGPNTAPTLTSSTRDGFGFYGYRSLGAGQSCLWIGTYTATA